MSNKAWIKVPLKNLISVTRVVTLLCYELSPKFFSSGESHDFWELIYVDRGEMRIRAGDEQYPLKQGEIVFHQPNEFHSIHCDGVHSASIFIVTFDCRSTAMQFFRGRIDTVPQELVPLMKRLIEECIRTFHVSAYPLTVRQDAPPGGMQLVRLYLEEFLIRMLRSKEENPEAGTVFTSQETLDNTLVQKICTYLTAHLYDRVTLEMLSEEFHFGKSRLCDVFKKSMGDSIIRYHQRMKIEESKRLLREKSRTVSEIAEMLGFESPAYFSRSFQKHTGVSPRAFRTMMINGSTVYMETEQPLV